MNDITNMNAAMKLAEVAIRSITTVMFYANYMDKSGNRSWENFKEDINKVISLSYSTDA